MSTTRRNLPLLPLSPNRRTYRSELTNHNHSTSSIPNSNPQMSGSIVSRLVLRRSSQLRRYRYFTEGRDAQQSGQPQAFTAPSETRTKEIAMQSHNDHAEYCREESKRWKNDTQKYGYQHRMPPLLPLNKPKFQRKHQTDIKMPNENKIPPPFRSNQSSPSTMSHSVLLQKIPPMISLDDVVRSINGVMDHEQELGIVDLDGNLQTNDTLPMVKRVHKEWVQSATFLLSEHGRPNAWKIQFENRSLAHAFLQRAKAIPFRLIWKPVLVTEWNTQTAGLEPLVKVDESMIRVENFPSKISHDSMRHLFRRYDLATDGPTILPWVSRVTGFKMFVVRFDNPSWARAAVRELQGVDVEGHQLRLAQYPKQIIQTQTSHACL